MSSEDQIDQRLRPLAETATQVIYWSEHCVVAYGPLLRAGMGVRFEIAIGNHQFGLGFTVADATGRIPAIAARSGELLTEKLPELSDEIESGVVALSAWKPFAVIGEALDRLTSSPGSAN